MNFTQFAENIYALSSFLEVDDVDEAQRRMAPVGVVEIFDVAGQRVNRLGAGLVITTEKRPFSRQPNGVDREPLETARFLSGKRVSFSIAG